MSQTIYLLSSHTKKSSPIQQFHRSHLLIVTLPIESALTFSTGFEGFNGVIVNRITTVELCESYSLECQKPSIYLGYFIFFPLSCWSVYAKANLPLKFHRKRKGHTSSPFGLPNRRSRKEPVSQNPFSCLILSLVFSFSFNISIYKTAV